MEALHQFGGSATIAPGAADLGGLRYGSLVDTPEGLRPAQDLHSGDLVLTADHGAQPLLWAGHRLQRLDDLRDPGQCPVLIEADAFGPGQPLNPVTVAPQQLIAVTGWRVELHFGTPEVLAPAAALIDGLRLHPAEAAGPVGYIFLLLPGHRLLSCDGLRCASVFPSPTALAGLDADTRGRLLRLFPTLPSLRAAFPQTARPVLSGEEARLLSPGH